MIGNIVDHRSNQVCPNVDAVFEPSAHDNAKHADGTEYFDLEQAFGSRDYFTFSSAYGTTVRDALLRAETAWSLPVTVYLYDAGSSPVG